MPGAALTQVARAPLTSHHGHRTVPTSGCGITRSDNGRNKITTVLDHRLHGVQGRGERVDHGLVSSRCLAALHDAGQPGA